MAVPLLSAAWGAALVFALGIGPVAKATSESTGDDPHTSPAEGLVRAALESEILGDQACRDQLLRQALSLDPEHPLARWHVGYVREDDQWVSLDQLERRTSADGRVAEYRRLRDERAGTLAGEVALARWCRDHELPVEAKFRWLNVLRFQPQHREALINLGMRWYNGRLRTRAEIEEARKGHAKKEQERREKRWVTIRLEKKCQLLVARWRRAFEQSPAVVSGSLLDELQAFADPTAVKLLDSIVQGRIGRSRSKKELQPYRTLSLKLIELLDASPDRRATTMLAEQAIDHPFAEVRTAAADALVKRPIRHYVPSLVRRMRSPVEAGFAIITYPDGGVTYRHTLYREGLDADHREIRQHATFIRGPGPQFPPARPFGIPGWDGEVPTQDSPETVNRYLNLMRESNAAAYTSWLLESASAATRGTLQAQAAAAAEAVATQKRIEQANAVIMEVNRRIRSVLRRATGLDLGPKAIEWQAWWQDYLSDYYERENPYERYESSEGDRYSYSDSQRSPKKPVYETMRYNAQYVRLPSAPGQSVPVPATAISCFAPGTKVWTLTGPVAIEKIKPGDRVLSQGCKSGTLTYKLVQKTTTRDPTSMIRITLGPETITATRGHPFWVLGQGWKMAKHLEAGSLLHGVSGALTIDAVEEIPASTPWYEYSYNLIVEDFHTYFVGDQRLLVHDNTSFSERPALVPGLQAP